MTDETKVEEMQGVTGRRKFLKTAAQVAVTAPAAVILMNATTVRAQVAAYHDATTLDDGAQPPAGSGDICGTGAAPGDLPVNNPIDCAPGP